MNFGSQKRRNKVFSTSSEESTEDVTVFPSKRRDSCGMALVGCSLPVLAKQDSSESSRHSLANDLESLSDNSTVFIQRRQQQATETSSNSSIIIPSPHFEVCTATGNTLYEILESQGQRTRRLLKMKAAVNMSMLNGSGAGICEMLWDGDTCVTLQRNGISLGKVTIEQNFSSLLCYKKLSSPKYAVWKDNLEGDPVHNISLNRRESHQNGVTKVIFNVCPVEEKSRLLGSIICCTRHGSNNPVASGQKDDDINNKPLYSLSFRDSRMTRVEKALWIAVVILMDFQE